MAGLNLNGMSNYVDTNDEYKQFLENLLMNLSIPVLEKGKFIPLLSFSNILNTNLFEGEIYIEELELPYKIMLINKNDMFYILLMLPFGIGMGEVKLDTETNKRGFNTDELIWLQIPGVEEGERVVAYNPNSVYFNGNVQILDFVDHIARERLPKVLASMGVLLEHECKNGFHDVTKNYKLVKDKFYNKELMQRAYSVYR